MKTSMKLLGVSVLSLGFFLSVVVAASAASPVETLQPASTITYNEEVIINDTLRVDSAYIGSTAAGVGGVTFFNGTMINASVDEDGNNTIPLTFGDDVRIDGEIYRTESGGDNPLKIADSLRPQTDNLYSLGEDNYRWSRVYAGDGFFGTLTASDRFVGRGAARAMVKVHGDIGDCSIISYWTYNNSAVSCTGAQGNYDVNFDSASFDFVASADNYYLSVTTEPLTAGPNPQPYLSGSYFSDADTVATMIADNTLMNVPTDYQLIIY